MCIALAIVVNFTYHVFLEVTFVVITGFGDVIRVPSVLGVEIWIIFTYGGDSVMAAGTVLRIVSAYKVIRGISGITQFCSLTIVDQPK